ncbi:Similar to phosphoglycolate phosphatase, clustered with ribosomal large subunit pseudouridine synthase C [hydrothermal vent metagenome]|uniref:Similar to phosphoglycolate phosphatase, clustered with ribosomal large subunit pseudouridine synthase C n=1 Tax=hydrothermal vent metagenome TaxID=652676 RepID=A0A3B0T5Y0_9ZZZZ
MKLVIFDCDGTIVDSAAAIIATMEGAFAHAGLAPPSPSAVRNAIGLSLETCIARLVDDPALVPSVAQAYRESFAAGGRARAHGLFPGARAVIMELVARSDMVLGIATGKSRRGLDAVLDHHSFEAHFVTTKTADDAPSKPHPGMVLMCMDEAGVGPADTLVIGDTTFDMEMARAAGAGALGVSWGSHDAVELLTSGARSVVFDFPRLLPAIDGYFDEANGK